MRTIHHIAIGALDPDRVAAWYAAAFDLPVAAHHRYPDGSTRSIWLDADGTLLMVERSSQERRSEPGIAAGPFLVAFSVRPEERSALVERAGGAPESETEYSTYFRDPEGNRVAVSHWPHPAVRASG